TESKSSAAPKQLAQAKIPTPPAPEYRPNLAPPKPARFANAVGGENNVSTNAVSVPTPCVYATTAAPSRAKLMLNEIAWMGSAADANDEWMELKNISGGELNVSGWQLVDAGDQIHITFPEQTMIPAGGLFLLERTDDDTVSTIPADYIYVGALGNTNDGVRMFDANCLLQDEVPGDPWPAGEVGTKRTMERAIDFFWYTSSGTGPSGILGTPRMENSTRQAAQINLSRAGLGSAPPIPEPAPAVAASSGATHVVISEIHAGTDGGSDNEFIELYNPTDTEVDLTGWSLKKKSSTGNESALVAASRLSGKRIGAKSFFLLGNDGGYTGSVAVDASWARSNTIAYENNSVVLYNVSDENVDEVHWAEIVKGQSVERKAVDGGICASASGAGAYLGNGCDTNADADMESRASPEPQNGASLPEPRTSLSITNFNVNYDKATQRVALSWDGATDARGATSSVRYIIEDVSDAATTTSVFSGTATTSYVYRVTDIGRDYAYRVAATDAGGLTGEASRATTTATSPITTLKFFTNPNTGATDARIFLTFDSYPLLTQRTGMSTWQILVFSLNADPVRQASLDTAAAWTPNDQADLLSVRYRNYSGWMTRYSLILPDDATRVGSSGGIDNSAMRWSDIEIGKFMIRHEVPPRPFTSADYVMVSIYDFAGSGGGNQWFRFAAADKTKYYFSDVAPVTAPPTPPASALVERYDAGLSKAVIGWDPSSTDSDGMNREIGYEVNRATSTAVERFPDNEWVRFTQGVAGANSPDFKYTYSFATSSNTYVFGVRAVDEFGYVSSVATTAPYTVP
ncbi:MAG: lamin tail domain-containing protein, partial [bacterium]|nr:lamin tail domain-containing protein [bacterium]